MIAKPITTIAEAHQLVTQRIRDIGWSRGQVSTAAKPFGVSRTVVYDFVDHGDTRERFNFNDLAGICAAIGLGMIPIVTIPLARPVADDDAAAE